MAVNPSGPESLPLMYLRELISYSDNFQTWTGEDSQGDALTRILYASTKDREIEHPMAFVKFGDSFNAEAQAGGIDTAFMGGDSGNVNLVFEAKIGDGITKEDEGVLDFMNQVGGVLEDIMDLSGSESGGVVFLNVTGISRASGPRVVSLADGDKQIDYYQVEYAINWN